MRPTKKLVLCGIFSSIGFGLIALGSLLETLNLAIAYIVSLIVLFIITELDWKYALGTYLVISTLLILILGFFNFASFSFVFYIGHMPIARYFFDKLPKLWSWVCKIVYGNILLLSSYFAFKNLLFTEAYTLPLLIAMFVLANLVYILGFLLYNSLVRIYTRRFREKIKKYLQ